MSFIVRVLLFDWLAQGDTSANGKPEDGDVKNGDSPPGTNENGEAEKPSPPTPPPTPADELEDLPPPVEGATICHHFLKYLNSDMI